MSILGIGPLLAAVGALATVIVIVAERVTGVSPSLPTPWSDWALPLGIVLIFVGVYFWLSAALLVKRAYGSGHLTTAGVYGLSRNPMYAGFIVFIIPGVALTANDLLLLFISLAMFIAFKLQIRREEEYLAKAFGADFDRYRRSVAQLIPFIRM